MPPEAFDEITKEQLKSNLGCSDKQVKILEENPKTNRIISKGQVLGTKKMVATCISASNCFANKAGDRYVFSGHGMMIKDETCEVPCLWAMSAFRPLSYIIYDRAASGLDPNGLHLDTVSCPDVGCENGGVGTAMFRITVEDM